MKRFKNILVVLDAENRPDPALQRAEKLAESNNADLTIVACLEEIGRYGIAGRLRETITDALTARLEQAAGPIRERGIPVQVQVLVGRRFLEIVRRVLSHRHDLVMRTARSRITLGSMIFGSTDMHLLRKCPCPVWLLHPSDHPSAGGVLAAVDFDENGGEQHGVNTTTMELATSLALLEKRDLHVVHAWSLPHEDALRRSAWSQASDGEVNRQLKAAHDWHADKFQALLKRYGDIFPGIHTHLLKGDPAAVIPRTAEDNDIEVIVMATVARTGVPGLLIGNTAEMVLNQVGCSVLTVKPAKFVSPVAVGLPQ